MVKMVLLVTMAIGIILIVYSTKLLYESVRGLRQNLSNVNKSLRQFRELSKKRADKNQEALRSINLALKSTIQKVDREDFFLYRQIESLIELNSLLGFNISGLRGWAVSPDAAALLYKEIVKGRPKIVVELGGGISSIIIAQALNSNKAGRLITIDHLEKYASITRKLLEEHRLAGLCEVRVAELQPLGKNNGRWYNQEKVIKGISEIDLLVVDGPPAGTNKNARVPAVSQLKSVLSKDIVIFMDDYDRGDEQKAAKNWLHLLGNHYLEYFETEKGTAIIRPVQ